MGWGRMLLLGNVGQQLDIGDLSSEIEKMHAVVTDNQVVDQLQEQSIQELRKENQQLKLYLATLLRLLVSKGVFQQEEIATMVGAIDGPRGQNENRPPRTRGTP